MTDKIDVTDTTDKTNTTDTTDKTNTTDTTDKTNTTDTTEKTNTTDTADTSDTSVLSAGFLFYSHPPNSEDMYFLMGMDNYNGKWSDFGGRRDENETEIDCAIREMIEETMNVVNIGCDSSCTYKEKTMFAQNMLKNKQYTYRIGLDITPKRNKQTVVRKGLDLSLLSVYYVCPFTHMNMSTKSIHATKRLRVCYVKFIPWQPNLPELFSQTYMALKQINEEPTLDSKISYYETLPENLKLHPAVTVTRDDTTKQISSIVVSRKWLEKQQIAWWSMPRLKYILKNGGRYKKHTFRYGFLSTLGVVIEKINRTTNSKRHTTYFCGIDGSHQIEPLNHTLNFIHDNDGLLINYPLNIVRNNAGVSVDVDVHSGVSVSVDVDVHHADIVHAPIIF